VLQLQSVYKEYRDADKKLVVLQDINHTFPESGSVAIVGRSGIGKSTLLHILGGLDSPSRGQVLLDGCNLTALAPDELSRVRGSKIGFVFQFHHLLPEFSALENCAMPLLIAEVPESEAFDRAEAALRRVGLENRVKHRPGELSGGEQQRVAVARAIVSKPRLLLADEPTGNLDEETARLVQRLLLEIQAEHQSLLVIVTHSKELASSLDQVVEMQAGGALVAFP
jgi:lipoprotein-releasing system ATP-binding protein